MVMQNEMMTTFHITVSDRGLTDEEIEHMLHDLTDNIDKYVYIGSPYNSSKKPYNDIFPNVKLYINHTGHLKYSGNRYNLENSSNQLIGYGWWFKQEGNKKMIRYENPLYDGGQVGEDT